MKFLLVFIFIGGIAINAQNTADRTTAANESGFVALAAFKTLVENQLILFNDMLWQENGSPKIYKTYMDIQSEYGKLDLAYAVFKEHLINCARYNENKKKALACIAAKAMNIDSLSKGFLLKIDAALNENINESITSEKVKQKNTLFNPLPAKTALDIADYIFSLVTKAKDNRQKQLDALQAEILSDRYKLKSFSSLVKYRIGDRR